MDLSQMYESLAAPEGSGTGDFQAMGSYSGGGSGGGGGSAAGSGYSSNPYAPQGVSNLPPPPPGVPGHMPPPMAAFPQGAGSGYFQSTHNVSGPQNTQLWRDQQTDPYSQQMYAQQAAGLADNVSRERAMQQELRARALREAAEKERRREELKQIPPTRWVSPDTKVIPMDKRYFGFTSDLIRIMVFSLSTIAWEAFVKRRSFTWVELKERITDSFGGVLIALVILYFLFDRFFMLVPDWKQPGPDDCF